MCEHYRQRHELTRLATSKSKHHALIAGSDFSACFCHAQIDVGRLTVKGSQDSCRVYVEPEFWRGVANIVAELAYHLLYVK
jgi:hypothetical protein